MTTRLDHVAQRVLGHHAVLGLAQDQADARPVVGMAQQIVHRREVEIHLPGVLGGELAHLEVDGDEAAELEVIEEQVDVEIVVSNHQVNAPADESEARTQLHQELLDVAQQPAFQVVLVGIVCQGQEVEQVGIFQRLLRQVRLRRRQGGGEVGDGPALTGVQIGFNLHDEDRPTPAVLGRLMGVPEALERIFDFFDEDNIVEPGQYSNRLREIDAVQFCHSLRQILSLQFSRRLRENCNFFRVGEIERSHSPHITGRKARDPRKLLLNVLRQPIDDPLAPPLALLPLDDQPANVPVQPDHLAVDRQRCLQLRRADAPLEVFEQFRVACRQAGGGYRRQLAFPRRFILLRHALACHDPSPSGKRPSVAVSVRVPFPFSRTYG
jgi:hypothetical protein